MGNSKTSLPRTDIIAPRQSHPYVSSSGIPPVASGDRCCVEFDVRNILGAETKTWYLATVIGVKKKKKKDGSTDNNNYNNNNNNINATNYGSWTIHVQFDDNSSETRDWPAEAVSFGKVLTKQINGINRFYYRKVYNHSGDEIDEVYLCDLRPTNLQIGDTVFALFQNGHSFSSSPGAWHRGMVAAVYERNDEMLCDVAYDDEDYERGIPFGENCTNIILVGGNNTEPTWMVGLTVAIPCNTWKSVNLGTILAIKSANDPVDIVYTRGQRSIVETRDYITVLQYLMKQKVQELKQKQDNEPEHKFFHDWPRNQIIYLGRECYERVNSPDLSSSDENCIQPEYEESTRGKRKSSNRTTTTPRVSKHRKVNNKNPISLQTKNKTQTSRSSSRSPTELKAVITECDSDCDSYSDENHEEESDNKPVGYINNAFGKTIIQAINSSETYAGIDRLRHMVDFHKKVPNRELCYNLMDLMIYGPKYEGTIFPDSNRMKCTLEELRKLLQLPTSSKAVIIDAFSMSIGREDSSIFFSRMTSPYYLAQGDEKRTTPAALIRIGQTIHAKACFAEIYTTLLDHAIVSSIKEKTYTEQTRSNAIVCSLREIPNRFQGALEKAVEVCASFWISYGHFLYDDLSPVQQTSDKVEGSLLFLRKQAWVLAKYMGKAIALIAWLFRKETDENINHVAYLISRSWQRELERKVVDSRFLETDASKEAFLKKIKMEFLLQLQHRTVPQLLPKIAEYLNLTLEYNVIFGPE